MIAVGGNDTQLQGLAKRVEAARECDHVLIQDDERRAGRERMADGPFAAGLAADEAR